MAKKILVVDDEKSFREPIAETLEDVGYSTLTAGSGVEALAVMKADEPDLVITDIKMPKMDGVTLLGEINKQHPGKPVIMMSAYGTIENAVQAMKDGAFDYIGKPFNLDELLIRVNAVFDKLELKQKVEEMELYATMAQNIKTFGRIGASITHRFNNMLTLPKGNCDMWKKLIDALAIYSKNVEDADAKKIVNYFVSEGPDMVTEEKKTFDKMANVLRMWWDLSKDNPDKTPYRLSLIKCINTALELTQHELYEGNEVKVDYQENIPEIVGSYNNITRLYINLIINAIDATARLKQQKADFRGIITIKVSCDGNRVLSYVMDNGIGMDSAPLKLASEQLSSSKRVFPISQGGLFDSFGIVSKYGGKISVKNSGLNQGSTLSVTFDV